MTIFSLWRWCASALVLVGMILAPSTGYAARLGTAQLLRWSCPTPTTGTPAAYDFFGSEKLMHVVDAAGNDFQIHCIATVAGHHYEYYVSFPNGNEEKLSECIYSRGFNDVTVLYTGSLTETAAPTGTPILTVGSLDIVEHSNIEGTGMASSMTVKPGGRDFHVVHDFRNGHRYRVNTIGGRGTSTDILARFLEAPGTSILRAGVSVLASQSEYGPALAGDTAFRKLDDFKALPACEDCSSQQPSVDSPATQLQISRITGGGHTGMVIADPEFRRSTFASMPTALVATVPALAGRKLATMAIETTLLSGAIADTRVTVDGQIVEADILEHAGMARIAFLLDSSPHEVRVGPVVAPTVQSPSKGEPAEWDLFWVFGIGLTIALLAVVVFLLSRRRR